VALTKEQHRLLELRAKCRRSPQFFLREILGEQRSYPKQHEMLLAVRDCDRVAVCGCNSSGKDWASGRAILYWLAIHYPAKVVVYGPSERQVVDIVFNETRAAFPRWQKFFGGVMSPKAPRVWFNEKHHCLGFATNTGYRVTGFHSPHLLVIVTEAHGMESEHMEKIFTLQPECWLMTGNPFTQSGDFFEAFNQKANMYYRIRISAWDTPNIIEGSEVIPGLITSKYIEDAKEFYGADSPMYKASVLGLFPGALPGAIVPLDVALAASRRPLSFTGPKIAALDVAGDGDLADTSVLAERRGLSLHFPWKIHGERTTEVIRRTKDYLRDNPDLEYLIIDGTGIGTGVTDHLLETKWAPKIIDFHGGARPTDARFVNAISEAYWHLRLAYLNGLATADDKKLINQVSSRKYRVLAERQIQLQPKDQYRKEHPSPDEADAAAMTFAQFQLPVNAPYDETFNVLDQFDR
jgi:hypothetical protein